MISYSFRLSDIRTDHKFRIEHTNLPKPPRRCSRIGELCKNIGYEFSKLPNYFNQEYKRDAELELSQFTSMVKSNCSSLLRMFLCSLYFPPCIHDTERVTPPCKSVCKKVKSDCGAWIKRSGLKWPYKFECNNFPQRRNSACVELDYTFTHGELKLTHFSHSIRCIYKYSLNWYYYFIGIKIFLKIVCCFLSHHTAEPKLPRRCERLEIDACKGLGYTYVQMPNFFHGQSQSDAQREMNYYLPVVATKCSAGTLQFFFCLLYAPPCVINMTSIIPPCREVCEEVRRGCEQYEAVFNFPWPSTLACSRFPRYSEEGKTLCLTQPGAKPTTGKPSKLTSLLIKVPFSVTAL